MAKSNWNTAVGEAFVHYKELKKKLKHYNYSTPSSFYRTDEKMCAYLLRLLEKSKVRLFNIIDYLWEIQKDQLVKSFEMIKDELDILADEVFVKDHKGTIHGKDWFTRLINHDGELIHQADKLIETLDWLNIDIIKGKVTPKTVLQKADEVRENLDYIVELYKEREMICNISEEDMKMAYEERRKEIQEST